MAKCKEENNSIISDKDRSGQLQIEVDKNRQIWQIKVNIGVICVVWIFTFTAFNGLQDIESSLNPDLGTYALGSITFGTCIMCLVSPAVISRLGCKDSLVVAWVCLCLFIGGNYYPQAYLLLPTSFIEGIGTGLMWTAQGVYVTTSAIQFAELTGKKVETVMSAIFGVFCMAYQSTQIWGNLISSAILQQSNSGPHLHTNFTNETVFLECGAKSCPVPSSGNTSWTASMAPDDKLRYILLSVYMALAVIGLLITVIFLKPITPKNSLASTGTLTMLLSTMKLLVTNLHMMMLVPHFLYVGVQQTVMYAEFTKIYVSCAIGIGWVGYTMLFFGIFDTIVSPLSGVLGKYLRRSTMFLWALLLNLACLLVMLLWTPTKMDRYVYFIIPSLWGAADGIWQTQSGALIGSVFHENQEAGFANQRLFIAAGKTVAYVYSATLCESIKLYVAGALMIVSVVLHVIVEIRIHRCKREYDDIEG